MRLYRLLLKLYPARFREEYARHMELAFLDDQRESNGAWDQTRLWTRALADLCLSIPRELARETAQDLLHALRLSARNKFSTALAFGALALAIGTTTGIFSVVNAVMLRELPFRDADRLVEVHGGSLGSFAIDIPHFEEHRREALAFLDDGVLLTTNLLNVGHATATRRVRVTESTANFFSTLGVDAALGHTFLTGDDDSAKIPVAVLSQRFWQQEFGADPSIIGTQVRANGLTYTIIGIAPPLFDYPQQTDVWASSVLNPHAYEGTSKSVQAFGRLKTGLTFEQARRRFEEVVRSKDAKSFELPPALRTPENLPHLLPIRDQLANPLKNAVSLLFAGAAMILLIACANVAQLLLARLNERRTELSLRAALGASRARLIQQLIVEATALTTAAALAGLVLANWMAQWMTAMAPASIGAQAYTLDAKVVAFAIALALLCGLVFGVIPAWAVGTLQPRPEIARSRAEHRSAGRIRAVLLAAQAALTLVLLTGAFSLGSTVQQLLGDDQGVQTQNVVAMNVALDGSPAGKQPAAFYRQLVERLQAVPGVESAGIVSYLPLQNYPTYSTFSGTLDNGHTLPFFSIANVAGPGYFATMKQTFLAGRDFTPEESAGTTPAVIIAEQLAQEIGLGLATVGHRFKDKAGTPIVGVVRLTKTKGLLLGLPMQVFQPLSDTHLLTATVAVRVHGNPKALLPILRTTAQAVDPSVGLFDIKLMDDWRAEQTARPRFYTFAISALGAFAILLASMSLYGTASRSVAQRLPEISVRLAIGAQPSGVRAMLLRQTLTAPLIGLLLGLVIAAGLAKSIEAFVTEANQPAWTLIAGAALLLLSLCCAAVWRATAGVAKLNIMECLRSE